MANLSKYDIKSVLKEVGVVTKKDFDSGMKSLENKLRREATKDKSELLTAIANVATTSPTMGMFNRLEKRVDNLEVAVN